MWARYDCVTGEKEELVEHLKAVGTNAKKIASCLKDVISKDMEREAEIAGYFHDIFKVAYQPDHIEEFCKSNDRLSFRYHEVASAVFLSNYLLKVDDLGLDEDGIRRAVKAVLFHHQGLRAITLENFVTGYRYVIERIRHKSIDDKVNIVLKDLGFNGVNDVMELMDFRVLEGIINKGNIYDRFLSGILMVADNLTVMKSLNKSSGRLIELEICDYIKAINLSLIHI